MSKGGRRGLRRRGGGEEPGRKDKGAAGWVRRGRGCVVRACASGTMDDLSMGAVESFERKGGDDRRGPVVRGVTLGSSRSTLHL